MGRISWHGLCASRATTPRLMPAQYCEAVREDEQERLHRCRGHRRSCTAADDALRADQDRGAIGSAGRHRVRERWVMRRTAVVNQIRGLLLERGLTLPKGRSHWMGASGDPGRCPAESVGFVSRAAGSAAAGTGSAAARIEQMDAVIQQTAKRTKLASGSPPSRESAR